MFTIPSCLTIYCIKIDSKYKNVGYKVHYDCDYYKINPSENNTC